MCPTGLGMGKEGVKESWGLFERLRMRWVVYIHTYIHTGWVFLAGGAGLEVGMDFARSITRYGWIVVGRVVEQASKQASKQASRQGCV